MNYYQKYKKYKTLYKNLLGGVPDEDWDDVDVPLLDIPPHIIVSGDHFINTKEVTGIYAYDHQTNEYLNVNDNDIVLKFNSSTNSFNFLKNREQLLFFHDLDRHYNMSNLNTIPENRWTLPLHQATRRFTLNIQYYNPKPINITVYRQGEYLQRDLNQRMNAPVEYPSTCNRPNKRTFDTDLSGTYHFDFQRNLYANNNDQSIVLLHEPSDNLFKIKRYNHTYMLYEDQTGRLNYLTINNLDNCHWVYPLDAALAPNNYRPYHVNINFKERNVHFAQNEKMKMIEPPAGSRDPPYRTKGHRHSSETRKGLNIGDVRYPPTKFHGGKYY